MKILFNSKTDQNAKTHWINQNIQSLSKSEPNRAYSYFESKNDSFDIVDFARSIREESQSCFDDDLFETNNENV